MATEFHLERMLGIICSVFDAYTAVMFSPVPGDSSRMEIRASFSLGDKVDKVCVIEPGKSLVGWIVKNKAPLLINNFDVTRSKLGYYLDDEGREIKAFMGTPFRGSSGVLCLDSKRVYSFSEKDQKILGLFGDSIIEVDNEFQRLFDLDAELVYYHGLTSLLGIKQRFNRWKDFLNNYLQIVAKSTGMPYCFFVSAGEDLKTGHLEGSTKGLFPAPHMEEQPITLGPGMVGWVLKNNAPLFSSETNSGSPITPLFGPAPATLQFKSAICIPIFSGKITMGFLGMASQTVTEITDSMKNFSMSAGNYLALFLENLYFKSRLAEKASAKPVNEQ